MVAVQRIENCCQDLKRSVKKGRIIKLAEDVGVYNLAVWSLFFCSVIQHFCEERYVKESMCSPYSSVVEHSLRKRKVGGSIPPGGLSPSLLLTLL